MMTLTPEQRRALQEADDQPVELTDPQTDVAYVLVRADLFRAMRESLEDERQRAAIAKKALRNAAARMDEP